MNLNPFTWFGSESGGSERPPEPDPDVSQETGEIPIYRAEITYQAGSTETRLTTGVKHKDSVLLLYADEEPRPSLYGVQRPHEFDKIPYETLAERVKTTRVGEYTVTYTKERGHRWSVASKSWRKEQYPDVTIDSIERSASGTLD